MFHETITFPMTDIMMENRNYSQWFWLHSAHPLNIKYSVSLLWFHPALFLSNFLHLFQILQMHAIFLSLFLFELLIKSFNQTFSLHTLIKYC